MELNSYLAGHGLNADTRGALLPRFTKRICKTGELLLRMGENTNVLCFIARGLVRGYYLDEDGEDITKCLSKENDWCCVYNYFRNEPSQYYIEALEECELMQIAVADVKALIRGYPAVRDLYEKLYREAFFLVEEKGAAFQKMDAKQRYLWFADNNPELIKRVKQEYIASYLGVTPSSLSRIKRGL